MEFRGQNDEYIEVLDLRNGNLLTFDNSSFKRKEFWTATFLPILL